MARFVPAGSAALAALALAACSTDIVAPPKDEILGVPTALRTSQGPESVVPGEIIVALRGGAVPADVAAANGVQAVASGWKNSFVTR